MSSCGVVIDTEVKESLLTILMMVTSLLSFLGTLLQQSLGKGVAALLLIITGMLSPMSGDTYNQADDKGITAYASISSASSSLKEDDEDYDNMISVSTDSTSISIIVDSLASRQVIDIIEKKLEKAISKVDTKMNVDSILNLNIIVGSPVADSDTAESVEENTFYFMGNKIIDPDLQQFAMIITLVISIICIGFPLLALIIVIGLILRARMKSQREKIQVIEAIVRSGRPLPGILMNEDGSKAVDRRTQFSSAVTWLAVGVGIVIFFGLVFQSSAAVITLGIVPLMVGVVKLVLFFYDSRVASNDEDEKPKIFPPQFKGFDNDSSDEEV